MISVGYFVVPGKERGKVHAVKDGHPICGQKIDPEAQYQWCAMHLELSYVECRRCRKRGLKLLSKIQTGLGGKYG